MKSNIAVVCLAVGLGACATQKPQARIEADIEPPAKVAVAKADATEQSDETVERTVHFAYNSSVLEPEALTTLDKMAKNLRANQNVAIQIEGHTDDIGSDAFNLALGEERARSVRNYLVRAGVPSDRISMISYGKERPMVDGADDTARAKNRRGELVVR